MPPEIRYETWTTKDGRELRIKDMEDSHLVNTIRMLHRSDDKRYENDCATQPYWENGEDLLPERSWYRHKKLDGLEREAQNRGIVLDQEGHPNAAA